jgi:hypothetical protein
MRRRPTAVLTITLLAAVFVAAGTAPAAASTPTATGREITPVAGGDTLYFFPPRIRSWLAVGAGGAGAGLSSSQLGNAWSCAAS